MSGTRLVCLRSSTARVRGWIGSCLRKRPSMPCKCFATVKGFYFCSAQFCIIINFPLLLLRGREEPTAPSPPTMTSSSHKLVLFWMLRAELAPERSECNARLANSGKLTFLPRPNFSLVCEWVTKRPAHPLCERSHYGPIPRPVESPAWERRGRRTVAFSPLSRNPRALPELSPRGSGLPALVPGRRPGADPGPTGCAGVHPLRSPATFLTCLRSPR